MNWKALLANGTVQPHKTSTKEIEGLRQLVARDLADAAVEELSADRRFATAYNQNPYSNIPLAHSASGAEHAAR